MAYCAELPAPQNRRLYNPVHYLSLTMLTGGKLSVKPRTLSSLLRISTRKILSRSDSMLFLSGTKLSIDFFGQRIASASSASPGRVENRSYLAKISATIPARDYACHYFTLLAPRTFWVTTVFVRCTWIEFRGSLCAIAYSIYDAVGVLKMSASETGYNTPDTSRRRGKPPGGADTPCAAYGCTKKIPLRRDLKGSPPRAAYAAG